MLPILATIGSGLAWFATTMGQLIVWGAGIGMGFWAIKKVTNAIDQSWANKTALKLFRRHSAEEEMASCAAIAPQTS